MSFEPRDYLGHILGRQTAMRRRPAMRLAFKESLMVAMSPAG